MACYICSADLEGEAGVDPWPLPGWESCEGRCCEACAEEIVVPARRDRSSPRTAPELERDLALAEHAVLRLEYHRTLLRYTLELRRSCRHENLIDGPDQGIDEPRERVCADCGAIL